MTMVLDLLGGLGRGAFALFGLLGRFSKFCATLLTWMASSRPYVGETIRQCSRVGLHSAGIISLILFFIGANVALVGHTIFRQFGGQNMIGLYVGLSCVIGLAPLIVGAMLGAKPGTEIAATIASMRVKEQIDALEVMAVNPYWYLIVPRVLAYLIVTPPLVVFAILASCGGGYFAGVFQLGNNPGIFLNDLVRFLTITDIWKGMIRAEVFAIATCMISCFYGFYSAPGPAGVSRAINLAVVVSSTSIVVLNYVLTEMMY
jgi:phospholipid/cholesterol/gamma-HCH transport system permease protein